MKRIPQSTHLPVLGPVKIGDTIKSLLDRGELVGKETRTQAGRELEVEHYDVDGDGKADFERVRHQDQWGEYEYLTDDAESFKVWDHHVDSLHGVRADGKVDFIEQTTGDASRQVTREIVDHDNDGVAERERWKTVTPGKVVFTEYHDVDADGTAEKKTVTTIDTDSLDF